MIWQRDFSSKRGGQADLFEQGLHPGVHVSVYSLQKLYSGQHAFGKVDFIRAKQERLLMYRDGSLIVPVWLAEMSIRSVAEGEFQANGSRAPRLCSWSEVMLLAQGQMETGQWSWRWVQSLATTGREDSQVGSRRWNWILQNTAFNLHGDRSYRTQQIHTYSKQI